MPRTLSIIKPDAFAKGCIGGIVDLLEKGGLKVVAARTLTLSDTQARAFYAVHAERPFFDSLVQFMTSGPVMAMVLEGENAIARNREIMGATDPAEAADGTIRKLYAENKQNNAVHGSDATETALRGRPPVVDPRPPSRRGRVAMAEYEVRCRVRVRRDRIHSSNHLAERIEAAARNDRGVSKIEIISVGPSTGD